MSIEGGFRGLRAVYLMKEWVQSELTNSIRLWTSIDRLSSMPFVCTRAIIVIRRRDVKLTIWNALCQYGLIWIDKTCIMDGERRFAQITKKGCDEQIGFNI